jgi:FtsP/CotA-like multicopper oxidase with cupredoxin domain
MTSTTDLLAAISAHLTEFELPSIASVHVGAYLPGPQVAVQLSCHQPSAIAAGLLAWADTLTEITAETWRVPQGDSVHLSVTGRLPSGTQVQVYGALRVTDLSLGAGLEPGATITVSLATLRHLATPGQVTEEVIR